MLEESSTKILNQSNQILNFKDTFCLHVTTTMDALIENSTVNMILMTEDMGGLIKHQLKQKLMNKIIEVKIKYHNFLKSILNKGVEEGLFGSIDDDFTIVMASNMIVTSIMYFIHEIHDHNLQKEELINKIYCLVLKVVS